MQRNLILNKYFNEIQSINYDFQIIRPDDKLALINFAIKREDGL